MQKIRGYYILAADGEIGHVGDEIQRGPSLDTADIELIETMPAVWIV